MKRWKVDNPQEFVKDLEWLDRNFHAAVFKRVQSPPIIITSKTAFGYDLRESILPYQKTSRHETLEKEILAMSKYSPKKS